MRRKGTILKMHAGNSCIIRAQVTYRLTDNEKPVGCSDAEGLKKSGSLSAESSHERLDRV